jgi:hypothetical protein
LNGCECAFLRLSGKARRRRRLHPERRRANHWFAVTAREPQKRAIAPVALSPNG